LYCIVFTQNKKASEEERLLVEHFGTDEYILYFKNKKKFIPEIF